MGPALGGIATHHRLRHHSKIHPGLIRALLHLQTEALIVLAAQPQRLEQGKSGTAVLAGNSSCPQVGDGGLPLHCGIEALQVLTSPIQHPVAPGPHMPGKINLRHLKHPCLGRQVALSGFLSAPRLCFRSLASAFQKPFHELWRLQSEGRQWPGLPRQALRILQGALEDKPGHRVYVYGGNLAAQAHRFQWDGPAPGEGVKDPGCSAAVSLLDFLAEELQVRAILPTPVKDATFCLLLQHRNITPAGVLVGAATDHSACQAL